MAYYICLCCIKVVCKLISISPSRYGIYLKFSMCASILEIFSFLSLNVFIISTLRSFSSHYKISGIMMSAFIKISTFLSCISNIKKY